MMITYIVSFDQSFLLNNYGKLCFYTWVLLKLRDSIAVRSSWVTSDEDA